MNFLLDLEKEILKNGGPVRGHLMIGEIKLKNGILRNPSSNVVTGFVKEELNTNDMLQEILGMNKKNTASDKQLSVSANQWRLRSTRSLTHNSCYYYETGILKGDNIV